MSAKEKKKQGGRTVRDVLTVVMSLAMAFAMLPGMLSAATARAEAAEPAQDSSAGEIYTSYTVDGGSSSYWGDGYYGYLLDGDPATKWGCEIHETLFIEFHSAEAIEPAGYILKTGRDAANYAHRNPKDWCIKAKKNASDDWTTIASVTGDTTLQAANSQDYEFDLDVKNASWQYFRFEVSRTGGGEFQLAELRFRLASQLDPFDLANASVSGLSSEYLYTGSEIDLAYTVTAADGTELTKDRDYTAGVSPASVRETGSYTLTLSGAGSYTGTKTLSFWVRGAAVDISNLGTDDQVCFWNEGLGAPMWRVISPVNDAKLPDTSAADEVLLIASYGIYSRFDADNSNVWKGSDAQLKCIELYDSWTDSVERAALRTTTITETENNGNYGPASVEGEHFFLLSAKEAENYFTDAQDRGKFYDSHWFLRSPYLPREGMIGIVREGGNWGNAGRIDYYYPNEWSNARPACNLDPARVVMVTPFAGDPGASGKITAIPDDSDRIWRLTLLDDTRSGFSVAERSLETPAGSMVNVSYSGAQSGSDEYLTAILFDAGGEVLGWGRVGPLTSADGTAVFTIPEDLQPGPYTLKLLNERKGKGGHANAAGAFRDVALTVSAKPVLQVQAEDLTVTYSGEDVPDSAIRGSATFEGESVEGTWSFASGQAIKDVSDSGTKQVIFTPKDAGAFDPFQTTLTLKIEPKEVTVRADRKLKHIGDPDPELTATVTGLCGSDRIEYTLKREEGEAPGAYWIQSSGETVQGNYIVLYRDDNLMIDGHNPVLTKAVPSGCEIPGNNEYWTCKGCGKHFSDKACTTEIAKNSWVIPAAGHQPGTARRENETAASCTGSGGYDTVVYCSVCKTELSREHTTIPAHGHDWGEWVVTRPATETEAGEETRTCDHDPSHIETRPIPPTGHDETYVERAYRLILGRAGDEDGVAHWNAQLAGGASAGGIIRDFFRSEEYLSRGLTDAQTVALCYQAMLSRDPAPDEVTNWTAMLADGYSTTKLVAEFVASDEFAGICAEYGLSAGTIELSARDRNSNITRFVERCYTLALGRDPDEGGLNEWCQHLLSQDLTPERVAFGFVFSDEAKDRGLTDEEFIAMLYKMMLDREPDADGLANWVNALRQNTAAEIAYDAAFQTGRSEADAIDQTRQNIYAAFAQSEEFGLMIANFGF